MRKMLVVLMVALVLPLTALADSDLTTMSAEDLYQLRDEINLELASRCPVDGALASWDVPGGRIDLIELLRGTDRNGLPAVSLRLAFTNTAPEVSTFIHCAKIYVYQSGSECEWAFINGSDSGLQFTRVQPGCTFDGVICGYILKDDSATIDVEICEPQYPYPTAGMYTIALPD